MNALRGCCTLAALAALASPASAQEVEGVDAHGYHMAAQDGDARDGLSLHRPGAMNGGEWYATALLEYAKEPLSYTDYLPYAEEGEEAPTSVLLDNVLAANIGAGFTPIDLLRVDLSMPVYFASTGVGGEAQGAGVGDLRLGAMVAFLQPDLHTGGLGVGVAPWLDLPTGNADEWLGSGGFGGGGAVAVTLETGSLTLGGDLGVQLNPNPEVDSHNLTGTDQLVAGLGVGYLFTENMGVNGEIRLRPGLSKAPGEKGTGSVSPAEVRANVRGRTEGGVHFLGGGAVGLSGGMGTAVFRVFVGGGFGKLERGPGDLDGDGFTDDVDGCPEVAEVVNDWKDDDGCPDALGTVALVVKVDGIARSGIPVTVRGPGGEQTVTSMTDPVELELLPGDYSFDASLEEHTGGHAELAVAEGANQARLDFSLVPPGRIDVSVSDLEGNPIHGAQIHVVGDQAPLDPLTLAGTNTASQELRPGKYSILVKATDYAVARADLDIASGQVYAVDAVMRAAKVMVEKEQIQILDKVFFELDKAIIKSDSFGLLDEVASTILAYPHVTLIEVAGHTDDQGSTQYNAELSEDRAAAVRTYLVNKGVAGTKLEARGYGESQPIASNANETGRAKNRRVEFVILEQEE